MKTRDKETKPRRTHDRLMGVIAEMKKPGWTPQYNLVLRELADRTNSQTGIAWPGIKNIAARTWISPGHVSKIIGTLAKAGFVEVKRRDKKGLSSVYRVIIPTPAPTSEAVPDGHAEQRDRVSSGYPAPTLSPGTDHSERVQTVIKPRRGTFIQPPSEPLPDRIGRIGHSLGEKDNSKDNDHSNHANRELSLLVRSGAYGSSAPQGSAAPPSENDWFEDDGDFDTTGFDLGDDDE